MPHKKCRNLSGIPCIKGFRPIAQPMNFDQAVLLELDEYEAIKLLDYQGMIHEEAAKAMNISRPTLTRIYDTARKKVAKAFVEGKGMIIQGGAVKIEQKTYQCNTCGKYFHLATQPESKEYSLECPLCKSKEVSPASKCFLKGCGHCLKCFDQD